MKKSFILGMISGGITTMLFIMAIGILSQGTQGAQGAQGESKASKGGFWSLSQILQDNPRPNDQPIKWVYPAQGKHGTLTVVQAGAGQIRPHIHKEHDEIVYVFSGEAEFTIGDKTQNIKAGDLLYIPEGTVHFGKFKSDAVAISIYAPWFDPNNPDRVWVEK